MRKTIFLNCCLLVTAFFFQSCQKNTDKIGENQPKAGVQTKVINWLTAQNSPTNQAQNEKLKELEKALNFSGLRIEIRNEKEQLIIVPVNATFTTIDNKDKNPITHLVLSLSTNGSITKGNVIQFVPKNEKIRTLPENTFAKVFTYKNIETDGQFTVLNLLSNYLYDLTFEKGKLSRVRETSKKPKEGSTQRTSELTCIDWWLETTYYWDDGSITKETTYLTRTCDECGTIGPNGQATPCNSLDGGSGGGGINIEYEYAAKKPQTWEVAKSNYNYWRVLSTEEFSGTKIAGETQGGHFTSITHKKSFLEYGTGYSWEELNATTSLDNSRLAKAYVSGKVSVTATGSFVTLYNQASWTFGGVFP